MSDSAAVATSLKRKRTNNGDGGGDDGDGDHVPLRGSKRRAKRAVSAKGRPARAATTGRRGYDDTSADENLVFTASGSLFVPPDTRSRTAKNTVASSLSSSPSSSSSAVTAPSSPLPENEHGDAWSGRRKRALALVVGVEYTDYVKSGLLCEVRGCHADCYAVVHWLKNTMGVSPDDITLLLDEPSRSLQHHPSGKNITAAMASIEKRAIDVGVTHIWVYYSGHGSLETPDGRASFVSCIIPSDFRTCTENMDLSIRTWLEGLSAPFTVTWIPDSCHAGSLLRLPNREVFEPLSRLPRRGATKGARGRMRPRSPSAVAAASLQLRRQSHHPTIVGHRAGDMFQDILYFFASHPRSHEGGRTGGRATSATPSPTAPPSLNLKCTLYTLSGCRDDQFSLIFTHLPGFMEPRGLFTWALLRAFDKLAHGDEILYDQAGGRPSLLLRSVLQQAQEYMSTFTSQQNITLACSRANVRLDKLCVYM